MAMENPIDRQLKSLCRLSLEDISLRRVAVLLFSGPFKYPFPIKPINICERNKTTRIRAFKRIVSKLELPDSMMEPLVNITNFVFLEIYKWLRFHIDFLNSNQSTFNHIEFMQHLHWTIMGSIDYRKTAEAIVRDEKLDVGQRFMIACLYCFDEDIQNLWLKLSPQSKKNFYKNGRPPVCNPPREIVSFWTCILKGRVNELENFLLQMDARYTSVYQYAFQSFAVQGYEAGTRYFFEKLTCEERGASLVKMAKIVAAGNELMYPTYNDTLCYLLSQMNAEQFPIVLESSSYAILRSFMDWPRQDAFPEVAKLVKPYLTEDDYRQLFSYLTLELRYGYNAPKLLRDLFLITPKDVSNYYLNEYLEHKDTEMIQLMFSNMNPDEILEFVLSGITAQFCYEFAKKGEWDFLEFFFRASRLSKEDRRRFLVVFHSSVPLFLEPEISQRFTKMLNDISANTSKRDFSTCNGVNSRVTCHLPNIPILFNFQPFCASRDVCR